MGTSKLNIRLYIFALFLIIVGQTQASNICTQSRAAGLFANILCIHPITGESRANSPRCKQSTSSMTCCCTSSTFCEDESATIEGLADIEDSIFGDNYDDENFDGSTYDDPSGRSGKVKTIIRGSGFEDSNHDASGFCPFGMKRCCYKENEVDMNSIERVCEPMTKLNDFGLCQQGCEANLPKKMMTFELFQGSTKSPQKSSQLKPGFGSAFGRNEIITRGEKQCGQRQFEEIDLPDSEVSPGEFPWTCSLWSINGAAEEYLGSCAIVPNERDNDITKPTRRVITAAHKVKLDKISELKVRIEDANVGDPEKVVDIIFQDDYDYFDPHGRNAKVGIRKDYTVTQIAQHPNFDSVRLSDNIAVLKLEKAINLDAGDDQVNAVCMPNCNDMFDNTFNNGTGVRCWVAGWGNETDRMYQRKIDIPMYPDRADCERKINKALNNLGYPDIELHPGEICAGGEAKKDACRGDGGTPLMCQAVSGHWHATGLVSWGIGCGKKDMPAVYVNVFHYLDFIYTSFNDRSSWKNIGNRRQGKSPKIVGDSQKVVDLIFEEN